MRPWSSTRTGWNGGHQAGEQAQARVVVIAMVCLVVGFAFATLWLHHGGPAEVAGSTEPATLSDGSKAVLRRLDSQVEIRFYSLLDPAGTSEALRAYAERVDQMLGQLQRESGGKIKVVRRNAGTDYAAAAADGIQGFNMDKGEGSYFGLTLLANGRKETIPMLSPEWELALEPDLSRAIARVANPNSSRLPQSSAPQVIAAAADDVKRELPNLDTMSMEEATRTLRESALKEFAAAVGEMEAQVKAAQQRLGQAKNGGTEAEQQDAMKHLEDVQAEQAQKLQQIAAKSKAQIEALKQLKAAPR